MKRTFRLRSVFSRTAFHGFTLVELVVVVTILAVIATIGFLSLSGYSEDARAATVKANVRSVQTAIAAESAVRGISPRFFIVHDPDYALSGALAYVDGTGVTLTGGNFGEAPSDSNYTAGVPNYAKLKLDPDKFRVSLRIPGFAEPIYSSLGSLSVPGAYAAFDENALMSAAVDFTTSSQGGRSRIVSYVQSAGIVSGTNTAFVSGTFPVTDIPGGYASGLLRANPGDGSALTSAMKDGAVVSGSHSSSDGQDPAPAAPANYPNCDTPDITLSNGQVWAACNVGATKAWSGQTYPSTKEYLGGLYQWGRNDDVSTSASTSTLAPAGTSAGGVGHDLYITYSTNWRGDNDSNLWGGATTTASSGSYANLSSADKSLMRGPCANGYHVPTSYEWRQAAIEIIGSDSSTQAAKLTLFANKLMIPFAGTRDNGSARTGVGTIANFFSSTQAGIYSGDGTMLFVPNSWTYTTGGGNNKGAALSLRCVKNS